ncbi:putative bifunctional diguanylate cyclase/phosphodiesterase [Thioflexithrix psekupsensis]|uniref:cyclic-guanylate-specific phosphodiesterase n=1 Tax=Thioflexithrix psekupsensis TaxID=1570016 RepID=A0A251X9B6_9GAMM|nr:EAL domain-containing protein [Thioflexithrix psekupsensis]OUD14263.1 hypothetical protein TPSD3_08020 [Thioflexithrix psekupsensis]
MYILLVEESAQDYLKLRQSLDAESSDILTLDWAPNYDKASQMLQKNNYDLLLIAYYDTLSTLPFTATLKNLKSTPLIFLTLSGQVFKNNYFNDLHFELLDKEKFSWKQILPSYERLKSLLSCHAETQQFRLIFDHAFTFMALLDRDGYLKEVNQAARQFLDIRSDIKELILWETPLALRRPQTQAQLRSMFETAQKNRFVRYEINIDNPPEESVTIDVTMTPICLSDERVNWILIEGRDLTEHKLIEQQLLHANLNDPLTGLPNRQLFIEYLEKAIQRAHSRSNYHVAVLFLDLDRFRVINESLGHDMGDWVLMETAHRLQNCLPENALLARSGGDEFMILLEGIESLETASRLANFINQELSRTFVLDGYELIASASIGIAYDSKTGESADLLRDADTAMFHAKRMGKSCYAIFNKTMHTEAMSRLQIETDIHRALEQQDFVLFYQPQIELQTEQLVGVEALIRFRHPQNGLILPFEFLNVLEDTGLIVKLGEWIVQTACQQLKHWQHADLYLNSVAINLSPHQFRNSNLIRSIVDAVKMANVSPENLALEITESLLLEDVQSTVKTLGIFKDIGFKVTIDDFGTGYSCLNYLKRFPVDAIKIDHSFIKGIVTTAEDAAITVATIDMAHALGLTVIAEGVEKDEQRDFLIDHGCDFVQGYFYAPPLEAETLLEWGKQYIRMMQGKTRL